MKKLLIVVGTRPNFIKVTRFKSVAEKMGGIEVRIVHTGQHYDRIMSGVFFEQFQLQPDYYLSLESRTPTAQIGEIMMKLGELIGEFQPDMVLVPGDVNSTLAGALATHKSGVLLGHLESGLRSFDRRMPEEINRILTDEITDHFFVTERSGRENLLKEGKNEASIHFVGNTMIDTLVAFQDQIDQADVLENLGLKPQKYILMTMHRPATVDNEAGLNFMLGLLEKLTQMGKVVFPIHPRTLKNLGKFGLMNRFESLEGLIQSKPMDYFSFQKLISQARVILTDSGGIQEESTFKQVPCMTLRENTERPITVDIGSNELVPFDENVIIEKVAKGDFRKGEIPPMWDGKSTERILEIITKL